MKYENSGAAVTPLRVYGTPLLNSYASHTAMPEMHGELEVIDNERPHE